MKHDASPPQPSPFLFKFTEKKLLTFLINCYVVLFLWTEISLATCWDVCARVTRHNSGNWLFILTKLFYMISIVYRQEKEFDQANKYMEISYEVLAFNLHFYVCFSNIWQN